MTMSAVFSNALVSTLAGNLFIVGSIANIIEVDAAARRGIRIDWRDHARVVVPVTIATLANRRGMAGAAALTPHRFETAA